MRSRLHPSIDAPSGVNRHIPADYLAVAERTVDETNQPEEIRTFAGYAKNALGNDGPAGNPLAKLEHKPPDLAAYKTLARKVRDDGNADSAKLPYQQVDEMPDSVSYATGLIELFDKRDSVGELLGSVDGDLGDRDWALTLLDKAHERTDPARTPLVRANSRPRRATRLGGALFRRSGQ